MGMAVMLDAVISYLQSLQNQIEVRRQLLCNYINTLEIHCLITKIIIHFSISCLKFLSMKLSAASMYYELHTQSTNPISTTQVLLFFVLHTINLPSKLLILFIVKLDDPHILQPHI